MNRINYSLRQFKINGVLHRVFLPVGTETENFLILDPNRTIIDGDAIYLHINGSGGEIHSMIESIGGSMSQKNDEIPELNLKFIEGGWYMRAGSAV